MLRYQLVRTAVAVGILSALVEGGAAVVSGVAAAGLPSVLGLAMGVAGGAMLYVTVAELYPDIYAEGGVSHLLLHNGGPPHVVETAFSPS